eukprot:gene8397-biopygen10643
MPREHPGQTRSKVVHCKSPAACPTRENDNNGGPQGLIMWQTGLGKVELAGKELERESGGHPGVSAGVLHSPPPSTCCEGRRQRAGVVSGKCMRRRMAGVYRLRGSRVVGRGGDAPTNNFPGASHLYPCNCPARQCVRSRPSLPREGMMCNFLRTTERMGCAKVCVVVNGGVRTCAHVYYEQSVRKSDLQHLPMAGSSPLQVEAQTDGRDGEDGSGSVPCGCRGGGEQVPGGTRCRSIQTGGRRPPRAPPRAAFGWEGGPGLVWSALVWEGGPGLVWSALV